MGSFISDPYTPGDESEEQDSGRERLGDLLPGRLSDVSVDSVESVRDVRDRR